MGIEKQSRETDDGCICRCGLAGCEERNGEEEGGASETEHFVAVGCGESVKRGLYLIVDDALYGRDRRDALIREERKSLMFLTAPGEIFFRA